MEIDNPVLVEITRGGHVESRHRGAAVVVDQTGQVVHAWGDVDRQVFPRSSLKPLQALPLLESGAADAYGLTPADIALACGSHNSEPTHVERVVAWLAIVGLSVNDLECGTGEAIALDVTKAMARDATVFTRAHNNCSGKHAGFLTTALHMGEPTAGYSLPDHPVQRRVVNVVEDMCKTKLNTAPMGVDGCGVPVYAFPLVALARGMAAMGARQTGSRGAACTRVLAAMAQHPDMVAGTGRFDTRMMQVLGDQALLKGGAEGVHIGVLPKRGWGIALKVDDGAIRASELAMGALLDGLGVLSDQAKAAVSDLVEKPVENTLGAVVGDMRRGVEFRF